MGLYKSQKELLFFLERRPLTKCNLLPVTETPLFSLSCVSMHFVIHGLCETICFKDSDCLLKISVNKKMVEKATMESKIKANRFRKQVLKVIFILLRTT